MTDPKAPASPAAADSSGAGNASNAALQRARLVIETEMEARGYQAGIEAGHTKVHSDFDDALAEEARSAAGRHALTIGPEALALHRQQYDDNRTRLAGREELLEHAKIALRDQRGRTAAVPVAGEAPSVNALVAGFGVLGVALSVGLALHDAVFVVWFPSPVPALGASLAAGLVLGTIPTLGMLVGATHAEDQAPWETAMGFALGVAFGIAVYGLRVWSANGDWFNTVAWALALLEIVTVLIVKQYAVALHRAVRAHADRAKVRRVAEAEQAAATAHVASIEQEIADLDAKLDAHRALEAECAIGPALVPVLEVAAVGAVRKGYRHAVAANEAHRLGSAHLLRRGA